MTGDGSNGSNVQAVSVVAEEIRQQGGEAVADSHSVTSPEGGTAIIDTALDAWGRVDIVINNAGIVRDAPFEDMTPELFEPLLDVHLRGAFHVTRPAWKAMREQRLRPNRQHLLGRGNPGRRSHEQLRGGQDGVDRVNPSAGRRSEPATTSRSTPLPRSPTPGCWRTPLTRTDRPDDPSAQAVLDELVGQYLQKLDPALVAPVVAFLAHRDCPVSGEIYTVGAGHVARFFIGRTQGFYHPALSIEQVRDHLDEIRDEAGYTVPSGPADEMSQLFATIMSS